MRKALIFTFTALLIFSTLLTVGAAPAQVGVVESASELVEAAGEDTLANVAEEYVPTAAEYENLQYGEVIVWEGYEGYESGASVSSTAAYVNSTNASGFTNAGIPGDKVAIDADGNKYTTLSASGWPGFTSYTSAKAGTYTIVIRAKKTAIDGAEGAAQLQVVFRGTKNGTSNDNLFFSQSEILTDSFQTFAFKYDYAGYTADTFLSQLQIRPIKGSGTNAGTGYSMDSYGVYYKPFDNYEKPEFGEVVFWEGYETKTIGEKASGNATVYNENNGSGVTNCSILEGTVSAESPTGLRYATVTGNGFYKGISNGQNAKPGTYTAVIRARAGASSKMTLMLRGKAPDDGDSSTNEDRNWAEKWLTITDEFAEYSVSYNYIPGEEWLNQILVFANDGIEVDSYALYYKPFEAPESLDIASIRTDSPQGLRFAAFVDTEQKARAIEYGYIVALGTSFGSEDEYTNLTIDSNINKVRGQSYLTTAIGADPTIDKVFSTDGKVFGRDEVGTYFTAVVYNIPEEGYGVKLVVRPYLIISDGTVYYGEPIAKSIKDVAQKLVEETYNNDVTEAPEFIQSILG